MSANGVEAFLQQRENGSDDPLLVYFHGGGRHRLRARVPRLLLSLVQRAGVRVLNVDYRLGRSPFPAAVEAALTA